MPQNARGFLFGKILVRIYSFFSVSRFPTFLKDVINRLVQARSMGFRSHARENKYNCVPKFCIGTDFGDAYLHTVSVR